MLRWVFCLLVFVLIAPAMVLARGNDTGIANPANYDRAGNLAEDLEVSSQRLSDDRLPSTPYGKLISELFVAQFKCRKADFDATKAKILALLDKDKANAEREFETAAIRLGAARLQEQPESDAAKKEIGGLQYDFDALREIVSALVRLRDFIVNLQYRECARPSHALVEQARTMNAFRSLFLVERASCGTCPGTIVRGYVWLHPEIGELFENLVIYQRICDEEGFNRQRMALRSALERNPDFGQMDAALPARDEALSALDKIIFVPCGKQKPRTATAQPPVSGGTTEGPRTAGGTGQDATPRPSVTPEPQNQTPDEPPLPGLDDPEPEDSANKTDEDVSFESDQSSYRIAVQVPEACVGTTYTVTEDSVFAEVRPIVMDGEEGANRQDAAVPTASMSENGEDLREVPQEDVSVALVPEDGGKPRDVPVEDTPIASTLEDGEDPRDVPQEDVPVASVPEGGDEPGNVPIEEETDLGLVKAQETIVILALINKTDGHPVSNAVAKMLPEEPPLPGSSTLETAFNSEAFFEDDVEGGFSDDDGSVQLTQAGATEKDRTAEDPQEVPLPNNKAQADPKRPSVQARKLKLSIDADPRERLVVAPANGTPAVEALSDAMGNPALAPFVINAFAIETYAILVLSVPSSEISALKDHIKNSDMVSWFEPDLCKKKEEIDDPYFHHAGLWGQNYDDQWAIKRVGFSEEFIAEAKGRPDTQPIIVAVIDTGLDWYHPDLDQGSIWRNEDEIPDNGIDDDGNGYTDDIIGWNFVNQNNRPWDYDGHGTFVAGVIAAATNNSAGIAGVSPHARIMPLKALDEFGQGHASMIAEAIAYAADNGARVINLSLGGRGLTRVVKLAVEHATASGALVVVAAGNSATDVSEYGPAGIDGVVTVSATDQRDRQAGFSNWGEEIDISAPGVDVLSLRARKTDLLSYIRGVKYEVGAGIVGDGRAYYRASGTSFAAPIVAGAAALIMSLRPEVDARAVRRMLLNSAKDIETPGIDNYTGYGLLDVQAALAADPDFAVESRIDGVEVVQVNGKPVLRLIGTADASEFDSASLMLGRGKEPGKWLRVKQRIDEPVRGGVLMELPAGAFRGAKEWTIRLIARHKNGTEREARFSVTLG